MIKDTKIQDPIKAQLTWQPLLRGGTTWQTHRFENKGDVLLITPTKGERFLAWVIMLTAAVCLLVLMPYLFSQGSIAMAIFTLVSAPLFGLMGYAMFKSQKKMTFDSAQGIFFQGEDTDPIEHAVNQPKKQPFFRIAEYGQTQSINENVHGKLVDIHALQVISQTINSRNHEQVKRQFTSHELNLVMKDGQRINVMDHGKKVAFDRDVETLQLFLQVPVWFADEAG